jgi:hypothetical protein
MRSNDLLTLAVAALLAFCFAGCDSGEERPELQPATGMLAINGKVPVGATIVLHPADGQPFDSRGTKPQATVKPDGAFELTTYQAGDGAPVGEYAVSVLWFDDPQSSTPWDKLGGRLADPKRSNLRLTIEAGRSILDPIVITDVPVVEKRPRRPTKDADQVD